MGPFLARRLFQMVLTLFLATFVFFAAVTVLPGDPVRALFGFETPDPVVYEQISRQFHMDRPFIVQYGLFVSDLLRGDLGHSFPDDPFGNATVGPAVSTTLKRALPTSLKILAITLVLQTIVGLAMGVVAALRRRTPFDLAVYATAVLLVSVPVIVSALVLQAFAGFELNWLPAQWTDRAGWRNYVLPVAALSGGFSAYLLLLTRTELDATMRKRFIRAATARGIPDRRVIGVHAMRPSLVPLVTFLAANLGNLIAGLVIVEGIFDVPGIGGVIFGALQTQDRALIVVVILLVLVTVVVANTLADIAYSLIDPRIRLEGDGLN